MAAFAGIVDFDGGPPDRDALRRAAAAFPDEAYDPAQFAFGSSCGFAMRRLRADFDPPEFEAIVEDGGFVAVGDARIDDRDELMRELDDPRLSRSSSDGDLVASAYRRWGGSLASHLTGEFAIAFWDETNRTLHLARDHFGARPLYFARSGSRVAVASSPSALRKLVADDGGIDTASIADYIVIGERTSPDATFFRNLRLLPPAHRAAGTKAGFTVSRYWDYPTAGEITASTLAETRRELMSLYGAAVRDRLRAKRVSVELSGGLDSTSLAVLAHEELRSTGGVITGLTMSYAGLLDDDEPRLAGLVAARYGIALETLPVVGRALFEGMDDPSGLLREGPGWGAFAGYWRDVMRAHEESGPVAFSGEGGDYVLATESRPFHWWWRRGELGKVAKAVAAALASGIRPRAGLRRRAGATYASSLVPEWLDPDLVRESGIVDRARAGVLDESPGEGLPRARMRALLVRGRIEQSFESWHPTVTGAALVFTLPWFDRRLVEAALRWAPFPWLENKYVLRDAMTGRLPVEVARRPKRGLAGDPFVAMVEAGRVALPELRPEDWDGIARPCHSMDRPPTSDAPTIWAWTRAVEATLWIRMTR
jgi:asparagine synthase (glutamine-hydrolysing)